MDLNVLKITLFNLLVFSTVTSSDDWLYIAPNKKSIGSRKHNQKLAMEPFKFQNNLIKRFSRRPIPDLRPSILIGPWISECCPSISEIIQPKGGVSRHGRILELYGTNSSRQSFYQTSCREGVKNKNCRYLNQNQKPYSRCTQKYSYTYAIVREYGSPQSIPWRLDHIRVRSGCSCEIYKPDKKFNQLVN
ncbi:uncharacterized protein LOC128391034 [Panonychus citri]|uniref:uncharacterized protein LOC128391034 n=1 Tax=Panonychus citri TaxID=50023 RepID=UPI0023083488|nr:uncharacterized protein LOC128391034 [Panonychus citri]